LLCNHPHTLVRMVMLHLIEGLMLLVFRLCDSLLIVDQWLEKKDDSDPLPVLTSFDSIGPEGEKCQEEVHEVSNRSKTAYPTKIEKFQKLVKSPKFPLTDNPFGSYSFETYISLKRLEAASLITAFNSDSHTTL
jgi:hypothetical protein